MTDDRPTICQLLHGLPIGGAEVLADRFVRCLSDRYRFVIACLDQVGALGEGLIADGYTVHLLWSGSQVWTWAVPGDWPGFFANKRWISSTRINTPRFSMPSPADCSDDGRRLCLRSMGAGIPTIPERSGCCLTDS